MPTERHRELCARMMMPDSDSLSLIWELLADEVDAALLLHMPATLSELAAKIGLQPEDVQKRIDGLFRRGVVFESEKPGGTIYRAPRHLVQLHDASNQWPEAPAALYDLWKKFMHEEFPGFVAMALASGFPPFMRTVPTLHAAEALGGVAEVEDVAAMVAAAGDLAVCSCPCRLEERACDSDVERCLQLDKAARYVVRRGTGRAVTKTEALELLRRAGDAGLVHLVENTGRRGKVICNCCACCCAIIWPARTHPECRPMLAPSRYRAVVDPDRCLADGHCVVACPMEAIELDTDAGVARVDPDTCIGCGVCMTVCGDGAIALEKIRPVESIPD